MKTKTETETIEMTETTGTTGTIKVKVKKPIYKKWWFYVVIILSVIVIAISGACISMPFSYEFQAFIIRLITDDKNPSEPDNYGEILSSTQIVSNISYNSVYGNGTMDIISPKDNTEKLPLILYIHGGYYAGGDKLSKEPYCRVVANEGYIVANMNYVLAPTEQYPAQLIQANEALDFLQINSDKYNIDTNKIFIGGDSAGAHLSGILGTFYTNDALSEKIGIERAITKSQLKGVVLLCGFYEFYKVRETNFPLLNDSMWMFTGVKDYEDFHRANELNIIENVTSDFPNTYLVCGDEDPFYEQNKQMTKVLKDKNVYTVDYLPTTTDEKLKHEFQCDFSLKECYTALDMLYDFLERCSAL